MKPNRSVKLGRNVVYWLREVGKSFPASSECPGHEERLRAHAAAFRQAIAEAPESRRIYARRRTPRKVLDLKPENDA